MKRTLLLTGIALSLAMPALSKDAPVPDLLRRALATPASTQQYAYDFVTSTTADDGKSGPKTTIIRGRIDPSKPKGQRVTITSAEGKGQDDKPLDPKKIDEQYEKGRSEGGIFCDTFSDPEVKNAIDKGSTPQGRLFGFTPKAEKDADGEAKELMKKVAATAVVDEATGALRGYTGHLTKPHGVMLIATVKAFDISASCAPAPNGRAYTARSDLRIKASGLGRDFDITTVQTVSNLGP